MGVDDDLELGDLRFDEGAPAGHRLRAEDSATAGGQVGHDRADIVVRDEDGNLVDGLEQRHLRLRRRLHLLRALRKNKK